MINLRECLGVAVNSGSLSMHEESERAVDRVAALAVTEELGSLLWRLKYGDQRHYREVVAGGEGSTAALDRIAERLERWLKKREVRWALGRRQKLLPGFIRLVLVDWLHDKCAICHGRGMLGVERARAKSVRQRCGSCNGSGVVERTTQRGYQLKTICRRCCGNGAISVTREAYAEKPRTCPACNGLSASVLTPAMWATLLGVSVDDWVRYWEKPMSRLRDYLAVIDNRTNQRVKEQLERG